MQKIISYSYKNRIRLLASLSGFNVEFTNVYQRNVKIYSGIDNTLEFDIKNADQKRVDLTIYDTISLNLMDNSGNAIGTSPYEVLPTSQKGIATITIPANDIANLTNQTFKYSVIGVIGSQQTLFYADTHFTGLGMIELIGSVIPTTKPERVFNSFTGEIDLNGNVLNHSSAIPAKFYEAEPSQHINFSIMCTNFIGSIYLEATQDQTISVESFRNSPKIQTWSSTSATTTTIQFNNINIGDYCYFRIVWHYPLHGTTYGPSLSQTDYGIVNKIIVS